MARVKNKIEKCEVCEQELSQEERDYPEKDEHGRVICDECYRETQFTCAICENLEDPKYQHKILLVFDEEAGIPKGVYRIVDFPYYVQCVGIGGGWIISSAVKRLRDLPEKLTENDYPCGHVCRDCQKQFKGVRGKSL